MRKGRIIAGIMAVVMALTMLPQSAVTALAAGPAVNKTIELGADILVNDDTTSSAPKKVKAGDELTYTGRLDVASIQEEIKSTASGYESYMSMISLSNVSSSFSTTLTVPSDGLVVDESKVSASLTDNNLFRIAETGGVSYNSAAGTITVNMELKNSYNSKTFKQLYDDVNACAKSLDVTIQGISVKNNAREGDKYTVSGTVSGGFSGTANVFVATKDFSFNWTGAQTADGRDSQITDPSSKDIQCTVEVDSTTPTPDPDPDHRPASWDISKSKVATNLNDDYESTITLSMPSAEENLATEVAFVLDESSFSDTEKKAMELLQALKEQADNTGAKVQVDVIGFKRAAYNHGSFDISTQYTELEEAFKKKNSGGSNIHAGLLMAEEVLASNTDIPNSRKYMILVSDGDTYLYCKNEDYNTPYSRSFVPLESQNNSYAYGGYYDEGYYYPSEPYGDNVGRPNTADPDAWSKYLADVKARNEESNGDQYEFVWKYYDGWQTTRPDASEYKATPCQPRTASNIDMAFLYAAETYHDLASKYHCYSVAVQSLNKEDGGHKAYMDYLNGGAEASFDEIKANILYLVGAGSSIEDYMGYVEDDYDFDFVNKESELSMTVGGKSYPAEKIEDNKYGFDPQDNGSYNYVLEYKPGEGNAEHFTWTTNVNVTNFAPVQIIYKVKLTNPKTTPGTYGVYDEDGSKGESGLYTNDKATLTIKDSSGADRGTEAFGRPTVSYSVQAPSTPEEEHKRHHTDDTPATPETLAVTEIAEAGDQPIQIAESGTTEEPVTEISDKGAIGATGDNSMMVLYGILVLAAGAGLITWAARRRRTR